MSESPILIIHTDGASRGNPGPAAYAYVISRQNEEDIEEAGCLGRTTNNQAEYTALVRALEHALRLGPQHRLVIHSDSELMVKQMRGEYRVKDPGLKEFYDRASALRDRFEESVKFVHVRRALNSRADALCNEALDGRRLDSVLPPPPIAEPAPTREVLRDRAVACLRKAAETWAQGDASHPNPETVWRQLHDILKEEGALRRNPTSNAAV